MTFNPAGLDQAPFSVSFWGPLRIGLLALGCTLGALTLWSVLTSIASATIASGTVVVDSSRKIIQHADGGIVSTIHVREGQVVSAGQVLITLDESRLIIPLRMLKSQIALSVAQEARLIAERSAAPEVQFALEQAGVKLSDYPEIVADQTHLFRSRRDAFNSRIEVLRNECEQARAVLAGLRQQIVTQELRLRLTNDELGAAISLEQDGYGTKYRVREVRRGQAELAGDLAALLSRARETEARIQHSELEMVRVRTGFIEAVETDLQQLRRDRFELLQRLETVEDQVKRLEITAPVTGTVVDLAIHTVGGTVAPGAQLLEIVPKDDPLVIDAQVRPEDIENIHPGLAVEVRMPGFEGRHLPLLTGTVVMVSADRLWDRSPGSAPFFQVRVQLDDQAIRHLASSKLRPGVPVDLMILTGEQSPIEYLTGPLARFFRRAMRN